VKQEKEKDKKERKRETMAKDVKEIMKGLPVARRKKIEARAALLIAEETTLQEMRKARELSRRNWQNRSG